MNGGAVDCDSHFLEPPGLWREHLDPAFRADAPELVDSGGRLLLAVDGAAYPRNPVHAGLASLYRPDGTPTDAAAPFAHASTSPEARLSRLDGSGTAREIVYPTLGMVGASSIRDPALAAAHAVAYNRFAADRAVAGRVSPAMIVPFNHPGAAVGVLAHGRRLGLTVLRASSTPPAGTSLGDATLDPIWAAAQDLDVTVTFQDSTISATAATAAMERASSWRLLYLGAHVLDAQMAMAEVILGGIATRFPGLRFGWQETHVRWIPAWLRLLDDRFRRPGIEAPSDVFRRRCFVSAFPDEPGLADHVAEVGAGGLVFGSDWPHRHLFAPTADDWPAEVRARPDLDEPTAEAALVANPRRWFPA